jgi:hypothetical protein
MIDNYLAEYDYNEIHHRIIHAPVDKIYNTLRHLDFSESWISRLLFKIRGLNTKNMSFDRMVDRDSFFTIYEKQNREWLVGLLAESFKAAVFLDHPENFKEWNPGKGIKIAWNFLLQENGPQNVKVSTETRILCLNRKSWFIFSLYWALVRPFSGLIRKEMLRVLQNKCQN